MTVVTVSSGAVTAVDAADPGALTDTRHARALAVLRSAEVRTGVRKQVAAPSRESLRESSRVSPPEPPRESSRAQVRALPGGRANSRANAPADAASTIRPAPSPGSHAGIRTSSHAGIRTGSRAGEPGEGTRVLPVHPRLTALLPDGGLRTGTTVVVRGSTSLLLTLLAEASRDGAWTVLVGYPAAGMAAAADAGCDLARTLVVPLPAGSGVDASAVLAALIDGMDMVVVGPEVTLLDQDRRRLTARARERGTVLLAALQGWGGAHVVLEAIEGSWAGVDQGAGWLRRRTLRVRRTGRGSAARPLHLDVEVPVCRSADEVEERAGGARHGSENGPRLGLVG